jgi:ribosomal protein L37AE/L43A
MPMNRVQFQRGMSLVEFQRCYGTEAQCEAALFEARWPRGFVCPRCASPWHSSFERAGQQLWQCTHCRAQSTLTAGTLFAATKLPLTVWFLAMFLLTQAKNSISALELKRQLGVCYRSAWLIKHKLMQAMARREATRRLEAVVQLDDAFLGGERTGGKRGRGSENKVPFVAAVQTSEGRPLFARFDVLPDWRIETVTEWARRALAPSTHVVSDGLSSFVGVQQAGCTHEPIPHGTGKQSAQHARFIWVNTLLGNLKRSLAGTYHAFKAPKYGQRYLGEFQYRFNHRFDLPAMIPNLARAACRADAWAERHLRLAETHR